MKPQTLFLSAAFCLLAAALGQGCAAQVALDDRPCPCATGWTCCPSNNVCVAAGGTCSEGTGTGAPGPDGGSVAPGPLGADPIELAKGQSARCMVAAGGYLYWQNADGLVAGAPRGGGALGVSSFRTPLANNARCGLAVEGDTLFATSYSLGKLVQLSLRSNGEWAIGGTTTLFGSLTTPSSLALTRDAVIVTELDAGRVTAVPRTRAASVVLAEGLVRPDDVHVFTSSEGTFAYFVERGTVDGTNGAIKRVDAAGSGGAAVLTLAAGLDAPHGLEAVDGQLYFAAGAALYTIPMGGGVPRAVVTGGLVPGAPFAADPNFAYFQRGPGLSKVRLTDGLEASYSFPQAVMPVTLAVDDGRLFWSDGASVWSAQK